MGFPQNIAFLILLQNHVYRTAKKGKISAEKMVVYHGFPPQFFLFFFFANHQDVTICCFHLTDSTSMRIAQITEDDKTEEIFVKRKNMIQNAIVKTILLWIQRQKLAVLKCSPVYFTIGKNWQALNTS